MKRYSVIIGSCLVMFVIVFFVRYIGNNPSPYENAPLLHGTGTIEKIEFIREHDQKITTRYGRRSQVRTMHVADAYSIKVNIDGESKTGGMLTYNLNEVNNWHEGDRVKVDYKKVKIFYFFSTKIFVERISVI